jgi:hypothetical protein
MNGRALSQSCADDGEDGGAGANLARAAGDLLGCAAGPSRWALPRWQKGYVWPAGRARAGLRYTFIVDAISKSKSR